MFAKMRPLCWAFPFLLWTLSGCGGGSVLGESGDSGVDGGLGDGGTDAGVPLEACPMNSLGCLCEPAPGAVEPERGSCLSETATCLPINQAGDTGQCVELCNPQLGICPDNTAFCNPIFTDTSTVGVCTDRKRTVGSACSLSFDERCDGTNERTFCFTNDLLDETGTDPVFRSLGLGEGFCVEDCTPGNPEHCQDTTDPSLGRGVCLPVGVGVDGPTGLCSHECLDPGSCRGRGSLGNGTNCFFMPPLTVDGMTFGSANLCLDVLSPVTPEASISVRPEDRRLPQATPGTTPEDCFGTGQNGEIFSCEAGTSCAELGDESAPMAGCLRFCIASSVDSVGEVAECAESTAGNSVCVPFASTSTAPDLIAVGFCARQP